MILVKNGIRQFQTVYSVPVYTFTCKYCEAVFEAEKGEISIIHSQPPTHKWSGLAIKPLGLWR